MDGLTEFSRGAKAELLARAPNSTEGQRHSCLVLLEQLGNRCFLPDQALRLGPAAGPSPLLGAWLCGADYSTSHRLPAAKSVTNSVGDFLAVAPFKAQTGHYRSAQSGN